MIARRLADELPGVKLHLETKGRALRAAWSASDARVRCYMDVDLVAAPTGVSRRLAQMAAGALAIVASAGWCVAIVALWPVGSRPMIDGSPTNDVFNLILGYNGLGRIFGASGPGGGGGSNFSSTTGLLRLFNDLIGGQASWLLPAALLALLVGLWSTRRAPRTDRTRAALLLWGGWLLVSGLVFSVSSGVIHTYYTVALAPAIAALAAITGAMLWRNRQAAGSRFVMALTVLVTATWSWVLVDRTPHWLSWMRLVILVCAALAILGLMVPAGLRTAGRRLAITTAVFALVACLAGPIACSAETITSAHAGSIPSAGPSSAVGSAVPGGGGAIGADGAGQSTAEAALVKALRSDARRYRWVAASAASLELATGGEPVMAIGGFDNEGGNLTLAQFKQYVARGEIHYYVATANGPGGGPTAASSTTAGAPRTGGGGSAALVARARPGAPPTNGERPGAGGGQGASSSSITSWVKTHYKAVTLGGQTVYDLTQARAQ